MGRVEESVKPPAHQVRTKSDEQFVSEYGKCWQPYRGAHFAKFCEEYFLTEGGAPFKLLPFQRDITDSIFNWRYPDGKQRVNEVLVTMARSNGKTALCAALSAYVLMCSESFSSSAVSCAVDTEQAAQIFDYFRRAIENNETLSRHLIPKKSSPPKVEYYRQVNGPMKGRYCSLSSSGVNKLGRKHDIVTYDEAAFHASDSLFESLKDSWKGRENAFSLLVSTAGYNRNGSFLQAAGLLSQGTGF